jgi:hypothetical protein
MLLSQIRSCTAPHTGSAIEDNFLVFLRLAEAEPILEFFFREEQRVWL